MLGLRCLLLVALVAGAPHVLVEGSADTAKVDAILTNSFVSSYYVYSCISEAYLGFIDYRAYPRFLLGRGATWLSCKIMAHLVVRTSTFFSPQPRMAHLAK
jgi:hypothetical protein